MSWKQLPMVSPDGWSLTSSSVFCLLSSSALFSFSSLCFMWTQNAKHREMKLILLP